jgi:RNA polymerase sigma-70 factor (ECF subfamily)
VVTADLLSWARAGDGKAFRELAESHRREPVWLQPFPDAFLEGAAGRPLGPEGRYEQTEAISLAFVPVAVATFIRQALQ